MDALAKLLSFRLRVGRLAGVDVLLHWTLLLAVAWIVVTLRADPHAAVLLVVVLGGSVLAHELGHCVGARVVGGSAREVVLWPLGGLAHLETPHRPWPTFVAAAAGPLVNVALLLLALPPFLALGGGWSRAALGPVGGPPFLTMVVGVNAALAFFNLIPAYPMDGGRLLQAALWPRFGHDRAARAAIAAALLVSAGLGAWALVAGESLLFAVMALVALSALAERERVRAGLGPGGVDELEAVWRGDAAPARPRPGAFAAWRERRRLQRLEDEARRRVAMRARLDEVLAKVSGCGLTGLTREERRFLDEASQMLRREREGSNP